MKEKELFEQDGYVVIREFFAQAAIEDLSGVVDRVYQKWLERNHSDYINHGLINMHSLTHPGYFHDRQAERLRFFEFLTPPKLTTLIDRMFGEGMYFHNTQLFFNPIDREKAPYWHRDMQFSPVDDQSQASEQSEMVCLHIRIPLVEESGVELIPGTHCRWDTVLERDVRFEKNGHKHNEDLPGAVRIALQPGDILVFSGQMIHRGNYRANRTRKALDLCVGKYHRFTFEFLDEHNLPTEGEMEYVQNNEWYKRARVLAGRKQ